MGLKLSLSYSSFGQTINLLMRGKMTYQTDLGTDAFGNIQRITNALDKLPERLEGSKEQLANLEKQVTAAKEELAHPFALEDELQTKEARLALLNADLNIDGDGGLEVFNDTEENRDEKTETADGVDERDDSDDSDEEVEDDEPSCEQDAKRPTNPEQLSRPFELTNPGRSFTYGNKQNELARTGTYGKSAPSILDDVRIIKSEIKPPMQGNTGAARASNSTEIDI